MANYQVKLIILSKADRKHFKFLNIDHKKYHSVAVIDECLKHIQKEVAQSYQHPVNLRFHLVELVDVDDGNKQERVVLGEFEYTVSPDSQFLSGDRFYQIVESEIYLNNSNVDDVYKNEVLENIKQAKTNLSQDTTKGRTKNLNPEKIKDVVLNKWLKKRTDVSEPEHRSGNNDETGNTPEPLETETVSETTDGIEDDTPEQTEPDTEQSSGTQEEETDTEDEAVENAEKTEDAEPDTADDNEMSENDTAFDEPTEKETPERESLSATESLESLIDIPDFHLPKVKSRDVFLNHSDDPVNHKRLTYLFDRETRLASYKERRLVEIYHDLVEKYHDYLLANEQDVDEKLEEFEATRDTFVEEYTHDFKERMKEKTDHKSKTLEQQQEREHDDFVAEQKQALYRFEERQNNDWDEILTAYKEQLQNELKDEKQKAHKQFEEKKETLRTNLKEKVKADVYNYVMLDKQSRIHALNNEVSEYDEQTYKQLDQDVKAWTTEIENQRQQQKTIQHEGMEQAKYEAEKEKTQADILSMKEKDRELEANAQQLQAEELEQKQKEMAYKEEEQRLTAIEVDAKQKHAEAKKKEAERMIPLDVRKIGAIVAVAVLALFILIMFAFQLFFSDQAASASLVDNEHYVEAYEQYPNRYGDSYLNEQEETE